MQNKNTECKKKAPVKSPLQLKPSLLKIYILIDMFKVINFSIFRMFKSYLFVSLVLFLTEQFMNFEFQFYSIFYVCPWYFNCLFEGWSVVRMLIICYCLLLTLFYNLFHEIVIRFIYFDIINPLGYYTN